MRLPFVGVAMSTITAALLWPAFGHAQTQQQNTPGDEPKLAPPATNERVFADIVVTAQRRSEALQHTPVAVSVLTAQSLQDKAVFSQTDLQRSVPGLTVRSTSNSNDLNFSIRGQTVDSFSSSTSAVVSYFNEVPISPNSSIPFFDLSSVQVLKGPQGTLFGRNATGGAVLFTSAPPVADKVEGYAIARYGNYDNVHLEGAVNLPLVPDRVALRVAGTYQNRDGYAYNLYNNKRAGDVDQYGLRGSLLVKLSDTLSNTLVVDYNHANGSNLPNSAYTAYAFGSTNNGVPLAGTASLLFSPGLDAAVDVPGAWNTYLAAHPKADPDGLVAYVGKQRDRGPYLVNIDGSLRHRARVLAITNTTAWGLGENVTLKNIFGYGRSHTHDGADYDGTPFGIESLGAENETQTGFILHNRTFTDELQISGKTDGGLQYTAGVFYSNYRQVQKRDLVRVFDLSPIIPVTLQSIPGTVTSKSYAAYAQLTYDLVNLTGLTGLSVVAGGRYTVSKEGLHIAPGHPTYNRAGFFNDLSSMYKEPSYQFGLNYQVNPDLLLYVVTRRSFRSGGYNIFAPSGSGTAADGGAGFRPETAKDVELGLKYSGRIGAMPFRFNSAIYSQWVDNVQRTTYASVPNVGLASLTVNVPKSRTQGFEVDIQINPAPWLELGGAVSYTNAKFTRNENVVFGNVTRYGPYPDSPKWAGSAYIQTHFDLGDDGTRLSLRGDIYAQTSFYFSSTANTLSPGTKLPGYSLINLRASVDNIAGSGFSIAGVVRNLTDRTYFVGGVPVGQIVSVNSATPGDPRTYYVEATFRF